MKRNDWFIILGLMVVAIMIYFPIFSAEYIYTDESVQLWLYKKGTGFQMFVEQGRFITDHLFRWLFSKAHTVREVTAIRIFSFAGWMLSIPLWYFILKKVVVKEGLPALLPGFAVLYLVCSPVFTISVAWASCLELFLANTAGLLAGYLFYEGISGMKANRKRALLYFTAALLLGLVSLFTYQNGLGCLLLPFLLHLLAHPGKWKMVLIGVAGYLLVSAVYYFLFRYSLTALQMEAASRTGLHLSPFSKIKFFFGRPLASAYHFTYLVNEKNRAGILFSMFLFLLTILGHSISLKSLPAVARAKQVALLICLLMVIYLPSLLVKESYSSNRTLLALDMAIFLFVFVTAIPFLDRRRITGTLIPVLSVLFIFNAGYNLRLQFLKPVVKEYGLLRASIQNNYHPGIDTILFIRPQEDLYVKKYGISRSWDEFGVPSSFFSWVPEQLSRQIVFEKTGNRKAATQLVVRSWLGQDEFRAQSIQAGRGTILIDAETIIREDSVQHH